MGPSFTVNNHKQIRHLTRSSSVLSSICCQIVASSVWSSAVGISIWLFSISSDEKPPLSITFIGNQYLRAKLEQAAPQWPIYVQFIHLVINNNQDLKTAQKTIKALPDIEKNTPIGVLVFSPGEDTVVVAFTTTTTTTIYLHDKTFFLI